MKLVLLVKVTKWAEKRAVARLLGIMDGVDEVLVVEPDNVWDIIVTLLPEDKVEAKSCLDAMFTLKSIEKTLILETI